MSHFTTESDIIRWLQGLPSISLKHVINLIQSQFTTTFEELKIWETKTFIFDN